jgi:very-short-patch-repair endonuclease
MRSAAPRARTLRKGATTAENVLWYALRNRQLDGHKFVRQFPIGPSFADFACREQALVVELDGGQHALDTLADVRRTAFLNAEGYSVLRFWNNDVLGNRDGVIASILEALRGNPSPGLRFAPADLSPTGRGTRGADAAASARLAGPR